MTDRTRSKDSMPSARPYRPLAGPARVVQVLLAVYTLIVLAAVVSDWLEINLLNRLLHDPASVLAAAVRRRLGDRWLAGADPQSVPA